MLLAYFHDCVAKRHFFLHLNGITANENAPPLVLCMKANRMTFNDIEMKGRAVCTELIPC